MRKIRVRCIDCKSKLRFVKLLKECSGLGLKEAKDVADVIFDNISSFGEVEFIEPFIDNWRKFTTEIKNIGTFEVFGGVEWERELKMLQLSIGEVDEYVEFLSDWSFHSNDKEFFKILLSKLDKETLVELTKQIEL
jgi:hypothetical protein